MEQSADIRATLAQSLVVGLPGPEPGPEELALVAREGLGGVILFARNIESPRQVWEMNQRLRQAASQAGRPPLLVMVDQEGGEVARLREPFTCAPGASRLGRSDDEAILAEQGRRMGSELTAAGFNWNLAPVLDVHGVGGGVMARRSLGPDPQRVAELGAAFIQALQDQGCLACAKHFPGLGRTTQDTHALRPRVELSRDELEAMELVPFRRAARAGVAGIMVSHAVFPALDENRPASLSAPVIQGLLRDEMGFQGLVLSDDLEMGALAAEMEADQAAVEAYQAGCDLLLVCHRPELALSALDRLEEMAGSGELSRQRIQATARRLQQVKSKLPPLPPPLAALEQVLALPGGGT